MTKTSAHLRVDWPQCDARGLCAEVLPELIHVDEWGYPVIVRLSSSPRRPQLFSQAPQLSRRMPETLGWGRL